MSFGNKAQMHKTNKAYGLQNNSNEGVLIIQLHSQPPLPPRHHHHQGEIQKVWPEVKSGFDEMSTLWRRSGDGRDNSSRWRRVFWMEIAFFEPRRHCVTVSWHFTCQQAFPGNFNIALTHRGQEISVCVKKNSKNGQSWTFSIQL